MIDFHSHIVPYLDDGAKDFDAALDMLLAAKKTNTTAICSTPHYIPGELEQDKDNYIKQLEGLRFLAKLNKIDIDIISGLEVYLTPEVPKLYKEGKVWGIADSSYMLVELPMDLIPSYTEEVLYELRLMGVRPIIAHPERNYMIKRDIGIIRNMVRQGNLVQINTTSLRGKNGKGSEKAAEELIKNNLVHFLGSDCHNSTTRAPGIEEEMEYLGDLNEELYDWMLENNRLVLENKHIEPLDIVEEKKKLRLGNLFRFK